MLIYATTLFMHNGIYSSHAAGTILTKEKQARLEKILSFLAADENNPHLQAEAADLSLELGHWDAALDLIERRLTREPLNAVARYQKAFILMHTAEVDAALAITQALLDQGESQPALCYLHARGLASIGRFAEARDLLAELMPDAADFPLVPQLYIRSLHTLGQIEDALVVASAHLAAHPQDATVTGMASLLYLDHDDLEQAGRLATAALRAAPDNIDALLTAGSVALAYEQPEPAQAHFEKVLACYGDNGRAWTGIGLVKMQAARFEEAERALDKAVACMPGHLGTQNALSWVQILRQNYDGAKRTLEASLVVDRNFAETHGTLAVVAALQQRWDEAQRFAEVALRLDPAAFTARYAQSLILTHRGEPERAQALLENLATTMQMPAGGNLIEALQRAALRR